MPTDELTFLSLKDLTILSSLAASCFAVLPPQCTQQDTDINMYSIFRETLNDVVIYRPEHLCFLSGSFVISDDSSWPLKGKIS